MVIKKSSKPQMFKYYILVLSWYYYHSHINTPFSMSSRKDCYYLAPGKANYQRYICERLQYTEKNVNRSVGFLLDIILK